MYGRRSETAVRAATWFIQVLEWTCTTSVSRRSGRAFHHVSAASSSWGRRVARSRRDRRRTVKAPGRAEPAPSAKVK